MIDKEDLCAVCAAGDCEALEQILENDVDNKAFLDVRNEDGKSLLEIACITGRLNILKTLVEYGADLSLASDRGYTLAHWACAWGSSAILKYLLQNGADGLCKNIYNESVYDIASRYEQNYCLQVLKLNDDIRAFKQRVIETKDYILGNENSGVLTKAEKLFVNEVCDGILNWIDADNNETEKENYVEYEIIDFETLSLKEIKFEEEIETLIMKVDDMKEPPCDKSSH